MDSSKVIILIPGTRLRIKQVMLRMLYLFTRSKERCWSDVGSKFRKELGSALQCDAHFEVLRWSRWNSERRRKEGVHKLQTLIASLSESEEFRSSEIFCIGHSHGGNVAVGALASEQIAMCVTGVVCLGTPFLCFWKRSLSYRPGVFAMPIGLTLSLLLIHANGSTFGGYHLAADTIIAAFFSFLGEMVLDTMRVQSEIEFLEKLTSLLVNKFLDENKVEGWPELRRQWGRFAFRVVALPLLISVAAAELGFSGTVQTSLGIIAMVIMLAYEQRKDFVGIVLAVVGMIFLAFSWLVRSALFAVFFGPDLFLHSLFLDVTAETCPPGAWRIWQLDPPLSHSVYDHPKVPDLIAKWIRHRHIPSNSY